MISSIHAGFHKFEAATGLSASIVSSDTRGSALPPARVEFLAPALAGFFPRS